MYTPPCSDSRLNKLDDISGVISDERIGAEREIIHGNEIRPALPQLLGKRMDIANHECHVFVSVSAQVTVRLASAAGRGFRAGYFKQLHVHCAPAKHHDLGRNRIDLEPAQLLK